MHLDNTDDGASGDVYHVVIHENEEYLPEIQGLNLHFVASWRVGKGGKLFKRDKCANAVLMIIFDKYCYYTINIISNLTKNYSKHEHCSAKLQKFQ